MSKRNSAVPIKQCNHMFCCMFCFNPRNYSTRDDCKKEFEKKKRVKCQMVKQKNTGLSPQKPKAKHLQLFSCHFLHIYKSSSWKSSDFTTSSPLQVDLVGNRGFDHLMKPWRGRKFNLLSLVALLSLRQNVEGIDFLGVKQKRSSKIHAIFFPGGTQQSLNESCYFFGR